MASSKSVLISGGGVAGPTLAYFLSRAGHKCTIVERAKEFRITGQQVDVSGEGMKVVDHMGIREAIKALSVYDAGLKFVDENDHVSAVFPVEKTGEFAISPVKDYEIMRPDLARILWDKTEGAVEYIFGDYISAIRQTEKKAIVSFANSKKDREFDIVVAADGLHSSTRTLAFGPSNSTVVNLDMYAAFFCMPWQKQDGNFTKWFNAPGGRTVALRPNMEKQYTSAFLAKCGGFDENIFSMSVDEQKKQMELVFGDIGWEAPRILKEMRGENGDDFYLQNVAQVKSDNVVSGRVALLGDAGYCPSPVSGQGTTLALVGAYILAGCITSHDDVNEALAAYQEQVRPFAKNLQTLPPGVPWIVNPQTKLGINILYSVAWIASLAVESGLIGLMVKVLAPVLKLFDRGGPVLPTYPSLQKILPN